MEKAGTEAIARLEEEKSLRQLWAPRRWQELRDWLKTNCQELNDSTGKKVLEFEVWPVSEAKIRRVDRPALLHVEFDLEAYRVRYACGAGRGEYHFGVNTDGSVVFEDPYHRQYSPTQVGEKLLNLLLESPL